MKPSFFNHKQATLSLHNIVYGLWKNKLLLLLYLLLQRVQGNAIVMFYRLISCILKYK